MAIRTYNNVHPTLGTRVYVDEQAAVIGDVHIGDDSSVWPMCSIRGDVNIIRIGTRTNIQDGTVIHVTHRRADLPHGHAVTIGDEVTVGHRCIIHGAAIRDRCLIGMGSAILDGAVLESNVLLGAGSLVTEGKRLEGGHLWMGRPARRVRALTPEEIGWFERTAHHYVALKDYYRI